MLKVERSGQEVGEEVWVFPFSHRCPTHALFFGVWVHLGVQMKTGEQQMLDLLASHIKCHSINISKSHMIHCR